MHRFFQGVLAASGWLMFFLCQFLLASLLAWKTHVAFGFGYGFWYQVLHIDDHIAHYAPQNRFRPDFAVTDTESRLRLFNQISQIVANTRLTSSEVADQLEGLSYQGRFHRYPLLHEAEILHLQDVALLVKRLERFAFVTSLIWLLAVVGLVWRRRLLPSVRYVLLGHGGILLLGGVVLAVAGPKRVFYWLHVQVFPEGHPWFFYYQDSLMSTMMKAPDLFAGIGATWLLLAITLHGGLFLLVQRVLEMRKGAKSTSSG